VLPGQPPCPDGPSLSPAAAAAAASAKAAGAGIVIDAGFSSCYVVPFYDGQLLTQGESGAGSSFARVSMLVIRHGLEWAYSGYARFMLVANTVLHLG
jgi:hypothetical protein